MREAITISLSTPLRRQLDLEAKKSHVNRSNIVRNALSRHFAVQEFKKLRGELIPLAEKKGLYTDEDIFKQVS